MLCNKRWLKKMNYGEFLPTKKRGLERSDALLLAFYSITLKAASFTWDGNRWRASDLSMLFLWHPHCKRTKKHCRSGNWQTTLPQATLHIKYALSILITLLKFYQFADIKALYKGFFNLSFFFMVFHKYLVSEYKSL